jgi:hypothetical protein
MHDVNTEKENNVYVVFTNRLGKKVEEKEGGVTPPAPHPFPHRRRKRFFLLLGYLLHDGIASIE